MPGFGSIAQATFWSVPGHVVFLVLHLLGLACFSFIVARRMAPLLGGQRDIRFDRPLTRLGRVLQYWFGQWKHPRYRVAGTIHILIFAGFLVLIARAFSLLALGVSDNAVFPGGHTYDLIKDYAATIVFASVTIAAIRRLIFKPARYT